MIHATFFITLTIGAASVVAGLLLASWSRETLDQLPLVVYLLCLADFALAAITGIIDALRN